MLTQIFITYLLGLFTLSSWAYTHKGLNQQYGLYMKENKGFGQYTDSSYYRSEISKSYKRLKQQESKKWSEFIYSGKLRKGKVSKSHFIKDGIQRPSYASQIGQFKSNHTKYSTHFVKDKQEIDDIRKACMIARTVLDKIGEHVRPGITTDDLDRLAQLKIENLGAYPSPLRYKGFPKSICTSINEVVCHGIPDSTILQEGDLINLDVTVFMNGCHGDCSETFAVGEIDSNSKKLLLSTYKIWKTALERCKPGNRLCEIGKTIEKESLKYGYKSLANFCGHGIGREFHEPPNIYHTYNDAPGLMLPGMVFTVEPVICEGTNEVIYWPDDWTVATKDGKRSAQFEHTILITNEGHEELTSKTKDSPTYFWEK